VGEPVAHGGHDRFCEMGNPALNVPAGVGGEVGDDDRGGFGSECLALDFLDSSLSGRVKEILKENARLRRIACVLAPSTAAV